MDAARGAYDKRVGEDETEPKRRECGWESKSMPTIRRDDRREETEEGANQVGTGRHLVHYRGGVAFPSWVPRFRRAARIPRTILVSILIWASVPTSPYMGIDTDHGQARDGDPKRAERKSQKVRAWVGR